MEGLQEVVRESAQEEDGRANHRRGLGSGRVAGARGFAVAESPRHRLIEHLNGHLALLAGLDRRVQTQARAPSARRKGGCGPVTRLRDIETGALHVRSGSHAEHVRALRGS